MKKNKLSAGDLKKKKELEAQLGDDCAFFNSPIGLIALSLPEQPSEVFWKHYEDARNQQLETTGVHAALAVKCVVYPEAAKVREVLRMRPALAVRLSTAVRNLMGQSFEPDPDLEDDSEDAKKLQKLEKEHGEISWYLVPGNGLIVLAAPSNPATYRQFYSAIQAGGDDENAEEVYSTFALDCVVHPKRDTVEQLLKVRPALAKKMAARGDGLCGGDYEELGKS